MLWLTAAQEELRLLERQSAKPEFVFASVDDTSAFEDTESIETSGEVRSSDWICSKGHQNVASNNFCGKCGYPRHRPQWPQSPGPVEGMNSPVSFQSVIEVKEGGENDAVRSECFLNYSRCPD